MKGGVEHLVFRRLLADAGIPAEAEHVFAPGRRWRMDYAWPAHRVGLEVDGGIWTKGRHTRGAGWLKDTEKLNTAACLGWRMLRCTPQQLATPEMIATVRTALTYSLEILR